MDCTQLAVNFQVIFIFVVEMCKVHLAHFVHSVFTFNDFDVLLLFNVLVALCFLRTAF